jgi:hypothetical protein
MKEAVIKVDPHLAWVEATIFEVALFRKTQVDRKVFDLDVYSQDRTLARERALTYAQRWVNSHGAVKVVQIVG